MRILLILLLTLLSTRDGGSAEKVLFAIRGYSNQSIAAIDLHTGLIRDSVVAAGPFANALVVRNGKLYVVNSGGSFIGLNASIKVYSIADIINNVQPLPVVTVPVPDSRNPYDMVFASDTKAYISYLLDSSVAVFNALNNTIGQRIPVGRGPEGMAVANGKLYVANAFDPATFSYETTVSVVSTAADTVLRTLTVYANPQAVGVDNLGRPHVVSTGPYDRSGRITVFDPATDAQIGTVLLSANIGGVAFTSANIGYASGGGLLSYNATTLDTLRTGNNPHPIAGGSLIVHRDTLYIARTGSITLYDASTRDSLGRFSLTPAAPYFAMAMYAGAPTGIAESNHAPSDFRLEQNFPNPFNPTTTIGFRLGSAAFVSVKVYDVLGRDVATLVNEVRGAGLHRELFDASRLASGVYTCTLRAGSHVETRTMMFIR